MAKQRRLNKNVIGAITAGGIMLAIIVVAVAAYNASRRDPEMIARKAKMLEESGDWRRSVMQYQRAYRIKNEAKYLLEGARVARNAGDLGSTFGLLSMAYAQSPDDSEVLNQLLRQYWEIRDIQGGNAGHWADMLERAERLLKPDKEPGNLLALATKLEALEWLRILREDEAEQRTREADDTLKELLQLNVNDPYIALARAQRGRLRVNEQVRQFLTRGQTAEAEQAVRAALTEQIELLRPAVAAHPENVELRIFAVRTLTDLQDWSAARQMLEEGLGYLAEKQAADDPDLHFELANVIELEIEQAIDAAVKTIKAAPDATAAETRQRAEEVMRAAIDLEKTSAGLAHAARALELEPALYRAYRVRANLQRFLWVGEGTWTTQRRENERNILESYAEAMRNTINLESLRAVLAKYRLERLELIGSAFDTALSFQRNAPDDELKAQSVTYLRSFLQEAEAQFPEHALTQLMKGYVAVIENQPRLAVKAFTDAEKQAEKTGGSTAMLGYRAKEELSKLYRILGEPGLALQYTEQMLQFQQQSRKPAPETQYQQVSLLLEMDRAQDALPLIEQLMLQYPTWTALQATRAQALTMLNRAGQAQTELEKQGAQDPAVLFAQANAALVGEEYEKAAALCARILETNPNSIAVLDRYLRALESDGRAAEALAYVRQRLAGPPDPQLQRVLQSYEILYSEKDPEVRRQKQLEMIATIPDEFERAAALFNFWRQRNEAQNAQHYLDEMTRLRPNDTAVLLIQFDTALRATDCAKAEQYSRALAEANADQAGGATYRGRYLLVCGDATRALAEFRAAAREFPNDSELKRYTARALMSVTPPKYDEAIQLLTEAIQYDPQNFDARKLIYACYEVAGRRSEGIPHLEKAAELAAKRGIKDPFIEERSQLLAEEKDPRAGIARREEQRAAQPNDIANLLRLAELYDKVGETDSARERLSSAAELEPGSLDVARFAARFFSSHGDVENGEALLGTLLKAQQGFNEIVVRDMLARFYDALSDKFLTAAREQRATGDAPQSQASFELAKSFSQKALEAYRQAQDRVPEALASAAEADRRRAFVLSGSELAGYYRRLERWEEMIETYRAVLNRLDPEDSDAIQAVRLNIIAGLRYLRRFGEATEAIQAFRTEFPGNLQGLTTEVELLLSGTQTTDAELKQARNQARELLTRVIDADPSNVWSWYQRALLDIQDQRYTDARDGLLRAKELAPEGLNLAHRIELSRLYELMNRPELAEAELRELLDVNRGGSREVELRLIDLLQRTDQLQRALEFVNQLKARDPQQAFWPYQLGKLLFDQKQYSAAAGEFRKAVELTASGNTKTIEDWLTAVLKAQRPREVIGIFEGLSPAVLTPMIKAIAAEAYLTEKHAEIGVPLLEQAMSEAGQFGLPTLREVTRRTDTLLGREECVKLIRRVIEGLADPGLVAGVRLVLAELFATDDDAAKRAEAAGMLAAIQGQFSPDTPLYFESLLIQALIIDSDGQPEEAAKKYEAALEMRPNDLRTLNNLAYLLADRLGRPQEALPYAQRLQQEAPGVATVLDTVGWVYFLAGNAEQALLVFQEAVRLEPDNIAARYHLGMVLIKLDRKADARRELNRVLETSREQKNDEYLSKIDAALADLR